MNNIHRLTMMVPWQECWEENYNAEREQLLGAISSAGLCASIFHVGSTSIKNMISKPIIDILLCPEKDAELASFIPVLEGLGYKNLGECGRAGRFFLTKGNEENRTFYLHLCYEDNQVAVDQKLFQYIEQNDQSVFYSYMCLKKALASLFPLDRDVYRNMKSMFIDGVLNAYRLGERAALAKAVIKKEDKQIKYWIYEFSMSEKTRQEFDELCAFNEMTADEFFQAAVLDVIRRAKDDPEGLKQDIMENCKAPATEIQLIRCYPVYRGETEAQAYKRKLTEEAVEKDRFNEAKIIGLEERDEL